MHYTLTGKNGFKAKLSVDLPKQFPSKAEAETAKNFSYFIQGMFAINMIMIVFANGWPLFNVLQLLTVLSVLGMPMSPNTDLVLKDLWKCMNLMMPPLNNLLNDQMFGRAPETAIGEYLRYHCTAFVLVLIPVIAVFCLFTYLLCSSLKRMDNDVARRVANWIESVVCFRMFIRTVMACFMQLSIIAFAGYGSHGPNSHISLVLISGGCVTVGICFAAYVFAMVASKEFLENQAVRNMIGTLYDNVKTNAGRAKLANTSLFFARRIVLVLALIQDMFIVRFGLVVGLSLLQISYYLSVRPHDTKAMHYLECYNETVLFLALYFLPLFTDFVEDPAFRFTLSWVFNVALLVPLFAVNLTHTIYTGTKNICQELKAM